MSDVEARISPGIKALETLDRLDVFRCVVDRVDFGSEGDRRGTLDVAGHRVCWRVEGSPAKSLAIGLLAENAPRVHRTRS